MPKIEHVVIDGMSWHNHENGIFDGFYGDERVYCKIADKFYVRSDAEHSQWKLLKSSSEEGFPRMELAWKILKGDKATEAEEPAKPRIITVFEGNDGRKWVRNQDGIDWFHEELAATWAALRSAEPAEIEVSRKDLEDMLLAELNKLTRPEFLGPWKRSKTGKIRARETNKEGKGHVQLFHSVKDTDIEAFTVSTGWWLYQYETAELADHMKAVEDLARKHRHSV